MISICQMLETEGPQFGSTTVTAASGSGLRFQCGRPNDPMPLESLHRGAIFVPRPATWSSLLQTSPARA